MKKRTSLTTSTHAAAARIRPAAVPQMLFELSWEVCNQVGGIYTVIRSKVPAMVDTWGSQYCLIGPYVPENALSEFEELPDDAHPVSRSVRALRADGVEGFFGRWLVTGRPAVVLFNVFSVYSKLPELRKEYEKRQGVKIPADDDLACQAVAFGYCITRFFIRLIETHRKSGQILAHFHEWLSAAAVPTLKAAALPVKLIFTTHATLLGRYSSTGNPLFYDQLATLRWQAEAVRFGIEARVGLERGAAAAAHVLTTVSQVTAAECERFLDRAPELLTPNGLNIERFVALHEFQNLHLEYKRAITQFVMGHFFPSYSFDLDHTLFFFTAGRFEFRNKGFDLTLEALSRLNRRLITEKSPVTVVMFFITKRPFHSINPDVLEARTMFEELRNTCNAMLKQVQERLLYEVAGKKEPRLPVLNDFIDDYWTLRLRRTMAVWNTDRLPIIVTHNLEDDRNDDILNALRRMNLINNLEDRVKIVYHPDFVTPTSPLFGLEYGQFVRGCHLGIFPSAYEPWGYTPLECIANGIPAVTSDLSGFGDYVQRTMPDHAENGIWVIDRRESDFNAAADALTDILDAFVKLTRRERITQRNAVENRAASFDWPNLLHFYDEAYAKAMEAR